MTRRLAAISILLGSVFWSCGEDVPAAPAPESGGDIETAGLAGELAGQDCVVIVLDSLHAAHLSCYGAERETSPVIDALAKDGVRLERAWSQASWTLPSTVSLFTGLYQETHGVHFGVGMENIRLADEAVTMAELFSEAGYETTCYTKNPFTGKFYGLGQGFDTFHEVRHDGATMAEWVAEFLATPSDRPRFTYVHFRRPHTPFDPPAEMAALFTDPAYEGWVTGAEEDVESHNTAAMKMDREDLVHHENLYAANIRQADVNVGRILDAVDRERTLVLVLSDHGEAFGQHGRLGHNWLSYEEYVHIPVVLAHPALPRGLTIPDPLMSIDVLPTLGELFGLRADRVPVQGRSFVPLMEGRTPAPREAVFTSSRVDSRGEQQLAVSDGRWKLIRQHPSGTERLFDLAVDPGERQNVLAEQRAEGDRLRSLLARWRSDQKPVLVVGTDEELSAEDLETLRALGYVR